MEAKDFRFFRVLRRFGITRILFSADLMVSLILTAIFSSALIITKYEVSFFISLFSTFIIISSAMVATSLAGLAIVSSNSDPQFIRFLKLIKNGKNDVYTNILFSFWYSPIISGIAIISDIVAFFFYYALENYNSIAVTEIFVTFSIFFFFYSIGTVVEGVGTTMKYGIYRGEFIELSTPTGEESKDGNR